MATGHLTERADNLAKKLAPPKVEDKRSVDEKLADFHRTFEAHQISREARAKVKRRAQ